MAEKITRKAQKERIVEQRMQIIAPLLGEGYTVRELRQEVMRRLALDTLSVSTVHEDIKRLGREWLQERVDDMDVFLALELNKIDRIIREAWKAWKASLEGAEDEHTKRKGVPSENDSEEITTLYVEQTKSKYAGRGDGRYLDIILKALERRHRLLGLDKVSVDMSGGITADIEIRHVASGHSVASSEAEVIEREGL